MNQKEIAEELGLTPSVLNNRLTGRRGVGKDVAKRLSRLTPITFEEWLFAGGALIRNKLSKHFKVGL